MCLCFFLFLEAVLISLCLGPGASKHPCREDYQGASTMSEKEVQIVARFLNSHQQKLVGYLDVHSYSQLWLIPWGYVKEKVKHYDELVSVQTNVLCKGRV